MEIRITGLYPVECEYGFALRDYQVIEINVQSFEVWCVFCTQDLSAVETERLQDSIIEFLKEMFKQVDWDENDIFASYENISWDELSSEIEKAFPRPHCIDGFSSISYLGPWRQFKLSML